VLTHYHAVRTLGAKAFGTDMIIAHENTRALIDERGIEDWQSEQARMPRLFDHPESIPGLTHPTVTFTGELTLQLGGDRGELVLAHCGPGHTEGDIVAWLPRQRILFAGDLVESQAALYTGDAYHREWASGTLDRLSGLGADILVGGRGAAAYGRDEVDAAIGQTRHFLDTMIRHTTEVHDRDGTLKEAFTAVHEALAPAYSGWPIFEHCLPFNVSRLWDELDGVTRPRIWTARRDQEIWAELQE
jgi:glyoxylase-like metal-dependent hydrolase (beta-lactamase superfamily II)